MQVAALHDDVIAWYDAHARDLPWRRPDRTPWGVLVSEVMLQQTPVARVVPAWQTWVERWPTPAALAAASPGDAVRQWGRLGYPRRALRLQQAAVVIVEQHAGEVPTQLEALRRLPGIGAYTAAAVATFAFGRRHAVLDTNVRRVLARVVAGHAYAPVSPTVAERRAAADLVPLEPARAAQWAVASMELGALVCTARSPRCESCPVVSRCAWRLAGHPADEGRPRRSQSYEGTDRQVRGRLLAVLREHTDPVTRRALEATWPDAVQRERALDGLVADGLVEPLDDGRYALPLGR